MASDKNGGGDKLRVETPFDGVRLLTIDRPAHRNALDIETYAKLTEAIKNADADPESRCVVVTGAGGNFTAGNDLADFQNRPEGLGAALAYLDAINECATPLVGAVEGHAVGIGVTMLLHFDFAYAARGAKMRLPFVALGACPEGGSSYLLPRAAGMKRAMELLLLGEAFDGAAAAEAGIVTAVAPDGEALDHALDVARKLATLPREAVRISKQLIRRPDAAAIHETIHREGKRFRELLGSPEAQAILAAFFARKR